MWQKVKAAPFLMYCAALKFTEDLKQDERGLSGVVVAVLLILIAVLAVSMIWGFLGDWINQLWQKIISEGSNISKP